MNGADIASIRINGGRLCLDFVNTATWEDGRPVREFLTGFHDLLTWCQRQGLIGESDVRRLSKTTSAGHAQAVVKEARSLRTAFRSMFEPGRSDIDVLAAVGRLNTTLKDPALKIAVGLADGRIEFLREDRFASQLIVPLTVSALELATTPARASVRVCPGDDCHWLFLDQSRNAARRWCSMESCGNKAKARAHYIAHRGGGSR